MPLVPINISAGVNTETTDKDIAPKWKDCNRIRFFKGYPETIGGWTKDSINTFLGVARGILNWTTLRNEIFIGLGTNKRLYLWEGGSYIDITPLRDSTSAQFSSAQLNNPFSTVATSDLVTVVHAGHGCAVGDGIVFSNATASPVDGIVVGGDYEVLTVINGSSYTIQIATTATTTENNFGGAGVDYDYSINVGEIDTIPALGWGSDAWGDSTWGTIRSISTEVISARTWQLDQWGEDLIANIKAGPIYVWDSSGGVNNRATVIVGAPASARFVLVSPTGRHLVGFGVHDGTSDDPLLIQWSTSEDYTDWDITSITNSAGELRIDRGTEVVAAIRTRGQMIAFTDISAHSMFTTGDSSVFGIELLGEGCGLISPNSVSEHSGIIFWMGYDDFYMFDGVVRVLVCDVWSYVYTDINKEQRVKFHSTTNVEFDEVWFFYCSANSNEINRYVKYNWAEKSWDYGNLDRTVWIDPSIGAGITTPYAADANGILYMHEQGVDADGAAMGSHIESHDIDIQDGDVIYHIRKFIPDFKTLTGSVDLTINAKTYPHSVAIVKGPYTINPTDLRTSVRARGRQISVKYSSDAIGDSWRLGTPMIQIIQHGRR